MVAVKKDKLQKATNEVSNWKQNPHTLTLPIKK